MEIHQKGPAGNRFVNERAPGESVRYESAERSVENVSGPDFGCKMGIVPD